MSTTIITGVNANGERFMFNFNTGSWQAFNTKKVQKGHKCDGGVMCHTMAQINAEVKCMNLIATQAISL